VAKQSPSAKRPAAKAPATGAEASPPASESGEPGGEPGEPADQDEPAPRDDRPGRDAGGKRSERGETGDHDEPAARDDRGKRPGRDGAGKRGTPGKRDGGGPGEPADRDELDDRLVRRHLAFGWWALAVFTALGLLLEAGHGLKVGWYLDTTNATRRLSLTLGHAHGTLLGFVNLAFAFSLRHARLSAVAAVRASFALRAVTVLMPLGFLLGGVAFYAGDPGFGIVLVPPTGALLVVALAVVAKSMTSRR
jgi:hypothetical protein